MVFQCDFVVFVDAVVAVSTLTLNTFGAQVVLPSGVVAVVMAVGFNQKETFSCWI